MHGGLRGTVSQGAGACANPRFWCRLRSSQERLEPLAWALSEDRGCEQKRPLAHRSTRETALLKVPQEPRAGSASTPTPRATSAPNTERWSHKRGFRKYPGPALRS